MANRVVIVHGWSDTSDTFINLSTRLRNDLGRKVDVINLADYISMDDDINIFDLAHAMNKAITTFMNEHKVEKFDVIAHSTGALITRTWLYIYYKYNIDRIPVDHLVMLAPANFGSHMAHRGKELFGVFIKGFPLRRGNYNKGFQVGKQILSALELPSKFGWILAMLDRFNVDFDIYNKDIVKCTVLVGNSGYKGFKAICNQNGSDGTVRVSASNMNCRFFDIDYSILEEKNNRKGVPILIDEVKSFGQTGFLILDDENHSTITGVDDKWKDNRTLEYIKQALIVTTDEFDNFCQNLDKENDKRNSININDAYKRGYSNFITHIEDNFGNDVKEYNILFHRSNPEFIFKKERKYFNDEDDSIATQFQGSIITNLHRYTLNNSYRSFLVDYENMKYFFDSKKIGYNDIGLSFSAEPLYDDYFDDNSVGYYFFPNPSSSGLPLEELTIDLFKQNETTFLKLRIRRELSDRVFHIG